jgi:hypothetical protein
MKFSLLNGSIEKQVISVKYSAFTAHMSVTDCSLEKLFLVT